MSSTLLVIICLVSFNLINCEENYSWLQMLNFHTSGYLKDDHKFKLVDEIYRSANISLECKNSIEYTLKSYLQVEDWSYELFNSWGEFPPKGVVEGTVTDLGDYDQCLSISENDILGKPQYCLVDITIPLPEPEFNIYHNFFHKVKVLPDIKNSTKTILFKLSKDASFFYWFFLRTGICTPNKCTEEDITALAQRSLRYTGLKLKEVKCEVKTPKTLNWRQIFAIFVFALFLLATIVTSFLVRVLDAKKYSGCIKICEAFSILHNLKKVLSSETSQELSCIHGIRVVTIVWVIFAHTIEWTYWGIFRKTLEMKYILTSPENQIILQAFYSVDTFFLISGLLTSYITLKYTSRKLSKFNSVGFLLSRYIRLTPQIVFFIIFTALIPLFGSGPVWKRHITPFVENCQNNWWQNIIYLQNFINADFMCGIHTWFIAADMQFHWISLIVVIALHRRVRLGLIINVLIVIAFFLTSSIIVYKNKFAPSHILTSRSDFMHTPIPHGDDFKHFFWSPWCHGVVFYVGLLFGYVVYQNRTIILSNTQKILIWIILFISYMFCFYDSMLWAYGQPFDPLISAFLFPLKKTLWAVNLCVVIWLCITGNGSYINDILSHKAFIPLSRLTYSLYLTHAWILWMYWGSKRDLIDMKNFTILSLTSSVLLISLFLSAIFSLLFEAPFFALQKYLREYSIDRVKSKLNNNEFDSIYKRPLASESNEMTAKV